MAIIDTKEAGGLTKARFTQLVRAGLPMNPIAGQEIEGANQVRLSEAMLKNKWTDPRFVSQADMEKNQWKVKPRAKSVELLFLPDKENLAITQKVLYFNARQVSGIPSLETMLAMPQEQFAALHTPVPDKGSAQSLEAEGELVIGPARAIQQGVLPEVELVIETVVEQQTLDVVPEPSKATEPVLESKTPEASGRFSVSAPYWLRGLHNIEGLALAAELDKQAQEAGLSKDESGIKALLATRSKAKLLGLSVIPEEQHLANSLLKKNPAQPEFLADGELIRNQVGEYLSKDSGKVVLEDKGDSLILKRKSEQGFKGAMELALAKGWTAIELSGKGPMVADAWLEAKMMGLEVVGYTPSVEDEKKHADRVIQENAKRAAELATAKVEQSPEMVEVRPYVDANGMSKTATIVYTVTQASGENLVFDNAKDAASAFAAVTAEKVPAVIRTVTRADGYVEADVMVAGTDQNHGVSSKSAEPSLDHEFSEALQAVEAVKEVAPAKQSPVTNKSTAMYSGMILGIEGNEVIQKVGRNPEDVKRHDIAKLSRMPVVGEIEDISYEQSGMAIVADKVVELER